MEIQQTPENALSHSVVKAVINAPIEKVNIADWLLNLPDAEYQKCSVNHIAAGATATYDGQPMSINVEMIGDALVIQHYVATEHRPDYCRMLSLSDVIKERAQQGSGALGIKSNFDRRKHLRIHQ